MLLPVTSLQHYLGHEELDSTMVYAKVSVSLLQIIVWQQAEYWFDNLFLHRAHAVLAIQYNCRRTVAPLAFGNPSPQINWVQLEMGIFRMLYAAMHALPLIIDVSRTAGSKTSRHVMCQITKTNWLEVFLILLYCASAIAWRRFRLMC
jgi:hypothetical protein